MTSFSELSLHANILKAISDLNYSQPTPVQSQALPILLERETDFVGLAQTGTGKTAAYGLPMIQGIYERLQDGSATGSPGYGKSRVAQAIVLCPTRELCVQVTEELQKFAVYLSDFRIQAVYGGAGMMGQEKALRKGVDVIVATPGRMLDHLRRGNVDLSAIRTVVLDEADKMLEMGFQDDVEAILGQTNDTKNVWLFSATMPPEIRRIARNYMTDPAEVAVGLVNAAAENVSHVYCLCQGSDRPAVLQRVLDAVPEIYGIIFTRTKIEAQDLSERLIKNGYNADSLHGDLSQERRERVMKLFRNRNLQLLVATDVAARGLDVNDLTHVINYGFPEDYDSYVHRAGRTARAGKSGVCCSIVTKGELRGIKNVERTIRTQINRMPIPSAQEVIHTRMEHFADNFKNLDLDKAGVGPYLSTFEASLADMSREELVQRLCVTELSRFLDQYRNARDLNLPGDRADKFNDKGDRFGNKEEDGREAAPRFSVNLGERDGLSKMDLLDWLADASGLVKSHINRIRLGFSRSSFELFPDELQAVEKMQGWTYNNRDIVVTPDSSSFGERASGPPRRERRPARRRERAY